MTGRRNTAMPLLSMLDFLLGAFGAMIVVAMMLTFLRLQDSRIEQRRMYFVIVDISEAFSSPNRSAVDLSRLHIDFELYGNDGGSHRFSPLDTPGGGASSKSDGKIYHGAALERATSASLLIPVDLVDKGYRELAARVQNLPAVVYDSRATGIRSGVVRDTKVRISAIIQTTFLGCAVERVISLGSLIDADRRSRAGAPAIFRFLAPGHSGLSTICVESDDETSDAQNFVVRGGRLVVSPDKR